MGVDALDPLRVSVVAGARRVDLALPPTVPVAELLPELARAVGLLDPDLLDGGLRLGPLGGEPLSPSTGLAAQGVTDGVVLSLARGMDRRPAAAHDDLTTVVADVVEHDLPHWERTAGRHLARTAGALLLVLALPGLLALGGPVAAGGAATVAAGSVVAGRMAGRAASGSPLGSLLGWLGMAYAAAAAHLAVPAGDPRVIGVGAAVVTAGVVAATGVCRGPVLAGPVTGGLVMAAGLVSAAASVPVAVVLTVELVLVVVAGDALPWLAAVCTGLGPEPLLGEPSAAGVHRAAVAGDVRAAHELLVGLSGAVGLLLVVAAPVAVSLGPWGSALALACAVVVLLRARRHRVQGPALVGRVSGVAGVVATSAAMLWWHAEWREVVVAGLLAGGVLTLMAAGTPVTRSVRSGRLSEIAETVALVSVPPLLLAASGLLSVLRVWVP